MDDALSEIEALAAQAWEQTETLFERMATCVSQRFTESSLATRYGCTCRVTSVRQITTILYVVRYHVDLPLRFFDGSMTGSSVKPHVPEIADIYAEHGGSLEGFEIVAKKSSGILQILETVEIPREGTDG